MTKKTEDNAPLVSTYVVLDNVDHDGVRYTKGDELELLELEACVLLALRLIVAKAD